IVTDAGTARRAGAGCAAAARTTSSPNSAPEAAIAEACTSRSDESAIRNLGTRVSDFFSDFNRRGLVCKFWALPCREIAQNARFDRKYDVRVPSMRNGGGHDLFSNSDCRRSAKTQQFVGRIRETLMRSTRLYG